VLGTNAYKGLANNDEFLQRFKYTTAGSVITPGLIGSVIAPPDAPQAADGGGGFEVLVASAVYNTAHEGATDLV